MKLSIPGVGGKYGAVLTAALLFFIVANPMTYQLVDSLLGPLLGRIAGPGGAPTHGNGTPERNRASTRSGSCSR